MKIVNSSQFKMETKLLLDNLSSDLYSKLKFSKAFVAGGALTSVFSRNEINDYDLYFKDKDGLEEMINYFEDEDYTKENESFNAVTYKNNDNVFQLIKLNEFTNVPEVVIDKFDFTINQVAYDFEVDKFFIVDTFLKDLAARQLVFNNKTPYPIATLIRVEKYLNKGFNINPLELGKIALEVQDLSFNTMEELEEHFRGVDLSLLGDLFNTIEGDKDYKKEEFLVKMNDFLDQNLDNLFEDNNETTQECGIDIPF
jgi:hypothetical protein